MPIVFTNVDNVYHGTTRIKKVYKGSSLEWELPNYFRIINEYAGSNTITLTKNGSPTDITLKYSTDDGIHWTTWSSANGNLSVTLAQGEEVMFKGDNAEFNSSTVNYYNFDSTQSYSVSGNIMTLVDSTGQSTTLNTNFSKLFINNIYLENNGLQLPATTLSGNAYNSLFYGCSSMTNAPALPATTLRGYCYSQMFYGCNLTETPVLPAAGISGHSYNKMFYGNSNLNKVTVYATVWTTADTADWLYGCAATGTFINNGGANIPTNSTSGVPSGWSLVLPDYLKINNLTSSNASFAVGVAGSPTAPDMEYSLDGMAWTAYDFTNRPTLTIPANGTLYLRGDNPNGFNKAENDRHYINVNQNFSVSGNIKSLLAKLNWDAITTIPDYSFIRFMSGQTKMIDASNLKIEATTVGKNALRSLLQGNTNLTTPPQMNVEQIDYCGMYYMFNSCSSLTSTPDFSMITTLIGTHGLANCFQNCTSLTEGADLTSLTTTMSSGLMQIYRGCSLLTKAYTPNVSAWGQFGEGWLRDTASSGTVYLSPNLVVGSETGNIPTNSESGIPTNWTYTIY